MSYGLCCTVNDIQCICSYSCDGCRCRCPGCACGPLTLRPRKVSPEPAAIPDGMRECRFHGLVPDDHAPCRRPGEDADEFTARMLGEIRDV